MGRLPVIYALIDPTTRLIRYVGKTVRSKARFNDHLRSNSLTHCSRWIQELAALGFQPEFCVLEQVADEALLSMSEIWWISYGLSCGWPLTNLTSGGDGMLSPSEETRQKISKVHLGRKRSEDTKLKISTVVANSWQNEEIAARRIAGMQVQSRGSHSCSVCGRVGHNSRRHEVRVRDRYSRTLEGAE